MGELQCTYRKTIKSENYTIKLEFILKKILRKKTDLLRKFQNEWIGFIAIIFNLIRMKEILNNESPKVYPFKFELSAC